MKTEPEAPPADSGPLGDIGFFEALVGVLVIIGLVWWLVPWWVGAAFIWVASETTNLFNRWRK